VKAVKALLSRGDRVCVAPQNITEFWNAATRPAGSANGLGMSIIEAHKEVVRMAVLLVLLPETERIYPMWLDLVLKHSVRGIDVYDARLVAAMRVHGLKNLLTFDVHDFKRYPEIQVFHPNDVR